jgi:hypothetical protein
MNIQEGARRMKRAGRWLIMVTLTSVLVLLGIGLVVSAFPHGSRSLGDGVIIIVFAFTYLAIPGGVLWLAGWITEGFAKNPD